MQETHRIALHMTANKRERRGKTQEVISGILSSQKVNRKIFGAASGGAAPALGTIRQVLRQVTARMKKQSKCKVFMRRPRRKASPNWKKAKLVFPIRDMNVHAS
jgi:hypothetical protein